MNYLWDSMTKDQKDAYDEWHTKNIREKGLHATLIDLISGIQEDSNQIFWMPDLPRTWR
jgi:hypothetical protein